MQVTAVDGHTCPESINKKGVRKLHGTDRLPVFWGVTCGEVEYGEVLVRRQQKHPLSPLEGDGNQEY